MFARTFPPRIKATRFAGGLRPALTARQVRARVVLSAPGEMSLCLTKGNIEEVFKRLSPIVWCGGDFYGGRIEAGHVLKGSWLETSRQ